ncbi:MAG TPA: hypothetical protein VFT64_07230 [Rickettsiales bacterium]|nr:hypothetical protein [Rickettsiales bacterium]
MGFFLVLLDDLLQGFGIFYASLGHWTPVEQAAPAATGDIRVSSSVRSGSKGR